MHGRLLALVAAGVLAAPLAATFPLAAGATPSPTGLAARNVAVCPAPQNTLTARCDAVRHEQVDRNGKPVSPNSSTPAGYTPTDLQGAYNLASASSSDGAGQTIAIVDAYDDPTAAADLAAYRKTMGLPPITTSNCSLFSTSSPCFVKVNQNGAAGSYPRANGGWAQEISLDLDMASAICPNCNILLVEASSSSFTNLGKSVNTAASLGAVAISNSYGSSGDASDATYGQYYKHPGIAVTASTGDNGYGVEYPASSDYTVAVGGTTLRQDTSSSNSRGWSESAWSGAGSGCSTYQNQPGWQKTYGLSACGSMRAIADVSADADPGTGVAVYDSYSYQGSSGWLQFGGTSVSSPIIASVYALAKGAGASWPAYPAALPYGDTAALYDALGGSNGSCNPTVLCAGGTGWDGPTGLGTPNGLAAFGGASGGGTTTTPTAGFTSSCTNLTCDFTDTSTDIGGSITGRSWAFGDGSGTSTAQNPSYSYGSGGTYTVTLTVTDSGNQTSSVSHAVTVSVSSGTAPSITGTSCSGATCAFTATGDPYLSWTFGNSDTSTGSPVSTTYTSAGNYTVTVTNTAGSASTSVGCVWNGHGRNKTLSCSG